VKFEISCSLIFISPLIYIHLLVYKSLYIAEFHLKVPVLHTFILRQLICQHITAGTLVPAVLMATSHSYGNGQTLATHRIRTH